MDFIIYCIFYNVISCFIVLHSYALYGAVAYVPGHYIAYVRRIGGFWEVHNDTRKKYTMCPNAKNVKIYPHLLMYALK